MAMKENTEEKMKGKMENNKLTG